MPQREIPYTHAQGGQHSPEQHAVVDVSYGDGQIEPIVRSIKGGRLNERLIPPTLYQQCARDVAV